MNRNWILAAAIAIGMCGCTKTHEPNSSQSARSSNTSSAQAEAPEPGETKLPLDQTPPAVRKTLEHELVGADLEDIARKEKGGKTIYETDIIRNGQKWEVNVGEDGNIVSKIKEGAAQEKEEKSEAEEAGWREKFDVSKSDLEATGNNAYLPIQPGKLLK